MNDFALFRRFHSFFVHWTDPSVFASDVGRGSIFSLFFTSFIFLPMETNSTCGVRHPPFCCKVWEPCTQVRFGGSPYCGILISKLKKSFFRISGTSAPYGHETIKTLYYSTSSHIYKTYEVHHKMIKQVHLSRGFEPTTLRLTSSYRDITFL